MRHEMMQSIEISSISSDRKKLDDKDNPLDPFICLLVHIENLPCYHPYQGLDNENIGFLDYYYACGVWARGI